MLRRIMVRVDWCWQLNTTGGFWEAAFAQIFERLLSLFVNLPTDDDEQIQRRV
jgi:hypothetical protein